MKMRARINQSEGASSILCARSIILCNSDLVTWSFEIYILIPLRPLTDAVQSTILIITTIPACDTEPCLSCRTVLF